MSEKLPYMKNKNKLLSAQLTKLTMRVFILILSNGSLLLNQLLDRDITIYTTNTTVFNITRKIKATIILLGGRYNPQFHLLVEPLPKIT